MDSLPNGNAGWKLQAVAARRAQIAELKATADLPLPWVACPQIPCGSIGWRMGQGEIVMLDWYAWMRGLTHEQFASYCIRHKPEESFFAYLIRKVSELRFQITSTPHIARTWPGWFERVTSTLSRELTTLSWEETREFAVIVDWRDPSRSPRNVLTARGNVTVLRA